jgi:hypothetical protein
MVQRGQHENTLFFELNTRTFNAYVGFEIFTAFWDITPCSTWLLLRSVLLILFLSPIGLLVGRVRANVCWGFNCVLRARQWELSSPLPLLSCLLHNPKFRQADCYAFTLVSCSAYSSTLKIETIYSA